MNKRTEHELSLNFLGSGKSCTMFGLGNKGGLLSQSVGFILMKKRIKVSAVEVIQNQFYDLIIGQKVKIDKTDLQQQKSISSATEFDSLKSKILKLREQKATNQNKTSSRSHLLITIRLDDNANASVTFIDLAGWESPKMKNDAQETQFINSSLGSLNTALERIAKKQVMSCDSVLVKNFKPYLTGAVKTCMYRMTPLRKAWKI